MDDLLSDFVTETNENLAELDVALVKLERHPTDEATLALIFRMVHTVKGTCGFLGLARLEKVAHAGENVLGKVRDGLMVASVETVSVVLQALDRLKEIVNGLAATGNEPAGDDTALIAALNALAEGRSPVATKSGPALPVVAAPKKAPIVHVAEPAVAPRPIAPKAAPVIAPVPAKPAAAAAKPTIPEPAPEAAAGNQTIRVGVDVLENLMTLVSELVLTRNQLLQLARSNESAAFTTPLQRLSHITSDLQEGVMKTRMQPIGNAWNKLPRLVRDLSHELNKTIELVMVGAETELDRQVLELIKDPLTHMVRNSGDHGLETPAERRAAGKPETGHINLNAYHEGGHIIIEIADDGRGLALDQIRAKALSRGLATETELAAMSDQQISRFIFHPGFSTAAAITAVSGRGVGMDVVKTNIEKIGGTVELKSVFGQGTSFTIKIPLTLAIVSALIVEAGGERFAIPQLSVVELVRASNEPGSETVIERINGTPVLRLRDRLLPLVSLNGLLRLTVSDASQAQTGLVETYIVVVAVGATTLGIIVDRVFDTEEIVVKPVAPIMRHITMFSGNTILGDGAVIMILDPNGIARATGIEATGGSRGQSKAPVEQTDTANRVPMLLFRAGSATPKAVPLGLVARLENFPRERIEFSAGNLVVQYRGRLMPLIAMPGIDQSASTQPVLVFVENDRAMGLMVDEIVDVIEDRLEIELSHGEPGLLGTAVIAEQATDVIDTGFWVTRAWADWFAKTNEGSSRKRRPRLLLIEDNNFFRQMMTPTLSAAGYDVTSVESAVRALQLRDGGVKFDVIISDVEMPEMNGVDFVRLVRASGAWSNLPLIALSGMVSADAIEEARSAGFTDYVGKSDRDGLIQSLRQCLSQPVTT